jgi:hypothetical protein
MKGICDKEYIYRLHFNIMNVKISMAKIVVSTHTLFRVCSGFDFVSEDWYPDGVESWFF